MDLEHLTAATFASHRGSLFRVVDAASDGTELRLIEADELPAQPGAPRAEPFSLVFTGPAEPRLEQRTYRLDHDELGELDIFLVPIGFAPDGELLYEAVFN